MQYTNAPLSYRLALSTRHAQNPSPSVLLVGNFDGVHIGHAALLRHARELAHAHGPTTRVVALTFNPHPLRVLRPEVAPPPLLPFDRRVELLKACGADQVVPLEPTPDLLAQSPEDFVRWAAATFAPVAFVQGEDFRFGRDRAGDIAMLRTMGAALGFRVATPPTVDAVMADQQLARASSTLARWLIARGRMEDAAAVLGRAHALEGVVEPGDKRGRTIGFPTANLRVESGILWPADGVYAAVAALPGGDRFPAAVNIGARPTFAGAARRLEAHILPERPHPDLVLDRYGWPLRLEFLSHIRDQVRFRNADELAEQLGRDRARASRIVQENERMLQQTHA